jgi:hypothetical protein
MNADRTLASAVRGPILLITLGTLFAVDHFGSYTFDRTWPILIIVFGLMKLLERALPAPAYNYPPPPAWTGAGNAPPPPPPPAGNVPPGGVL